MGEQGFSGKRTAEIVDIPYRPLDYWGRNLLDHLIGLLPRLLADDGVAYVMQLSILGQRATQELATRAGLAARDPWRFVNHPITSEDNQLLPAWRELVLAFPDRFMLGSDPVWPVEQLDAWDQDDTGWQELGRFWGYHRQWLEGLPDDVARRIRCGNAAQLFRRQAVVSCRERQ